MGIDLSIFHDLIFDYTLRNVALGSALLGIVSGILGAFAVLRRQGLLGDTLSHAALPGICLAFMLTGSRTPIVLLIGAGIAGWIGTLLLLRTVRQTKLSEDAMLGVVLSVFYGVGIVLLTYIQKRNDASQAGLDHYLFGQAAALVRSNVLTFVVLGGIALLIVVLLYKEFKLISFDPDFASSLGLPSRTLDVLLTSLLVVAVMIGFADGRRGPDGGDGDWTGRRGAPMDRSPVGAARAVRNLWRECGRDRSAHQRPGFRPPNRTDDHSDADGDRPHLDLPGSTSRGDSRPVSTAPQSARIACSTIPGVLEGGRS